VRIGLLLTALLAWSFCAGVVRADDKAAELKKLLRERRDTLAEVVKVLQEQYKAGRVMDFAKLAQAQREAAKAALDAADTPKERLAALTDFQKVAEANLRLAEAQVQAGFGAPTDVLQAKALLLEARIEILREELKAKPAKEPPPPIPPGR
jgi:outer membrane protein TolC